MGLGLLTKQWLKSKAINLQNNLSTPYRYRFSCGILYRGSPLRTTPFNDLISFSLFLSACGFDVRTPTPMLRLRASPSVWIPRENRKTRERERERATVEASNHSVLPEKILIPNKTLYLFSLFFGTFVLWASMSDKAVERSCQMPFLPLPFWASKQWLAIYFPSSRSVTVIFSLTFIFF